MTLAATLTANAAADQHWDAVVIGAGPAGSVAAGLLARGGRRTLLLDRAEFPRGKVCGCCLNRNALTALAAAGLGDVPARLGAVPLHRVQLAAGGRTADLAWPAGVSVSRQAFDAELIREAITRGAAFLPGTRGRLAGETVEAVPVKFPTPVRLHARIVIVADGLNGQVAGEPASDSLIGAGTVVDPPADYEAGTVFMATAEGGYVGLVHVEDGRLDVAAALRAAVVREHGGLGPAAVALMRDAGLPPIPDLAAADWKGTPALTRTARAVAGPRWFAVGDAGGYVEPFTGEGMGWAIAAAAAVVPLAARDWSADLPAVWTRTYRRIVGRRQATCRAVAWALRRPTLCRTAVRLLVAAPVLARPVVHAIHRPTFTESRPA